MDQIMGLFENLDFEAIINTVKDLFGKLQESGILDKIVEGLKGLVSSITGIIG